MLLNISFNVFSFGFADCFYIFVVFKMCFNRFSCMLNKLMMVVLCSVKSDSYSNADLTSELGIFKVFYVSYAVL